MGRWAESDAKPLRKIEKHLDKAFAESFRLSDNATSKSVQDSIEDAIIYLNASMFEYAQWKLGGRDGSSGEVDDRG